MSVTFFCPEAKSEYVRVPCDFHGCCPEDRCGYCQDGWMEERRTEAPELNLANANARVIIEAAGLPQSDPSDLWGELEPEEMAAVRRRITYLRNRPRDIQSRTRATESGPRLISFGLDAEGILSRLERLDALLAWAQERRIRISWG